MPKKSGSKAEFVRALPSTMPAKDVVEKAKDAGLKLTTAYVYVIRSQARTGTKKKSSASNGAPRASKGAPRVSKDAEGRLLLAASELGFKRSIAVIQAEKERIIRLLR